MHSNAHQSSVDGLPVKREDPFVGLPYARWLAKDRVYNTPDKREASVWPKIHASAEPVLSAVLMECPRESFVRRALKTVISTPSNASKCEQRVMVNIRMASLNESPDPKLHYILLDEVYDPARKMMATLMSPYLLEITRNEPVLMYPLKFTSESVRGQNKAVHSAVDPFDAAASPTRPPIPTPVNNAPSTVAPFPSHPHRLKPDNAVAAHDTPGDSSPSATGSKHEKHSEWRTKERQHALNSDLVITPKSRSAIQAPPFRQNDDLDNGYNDKTPPAQAAPLPVWPDVLQPFSEFNYPEPFEPADHYVQDNANMYPINRRRSSTGADERMERQRVPASAPSDFFRPSAPLRAPVSSTYAKTAEQHGSTAFSHRPSESLEYANPHYLDDSEDDASENFYPKNKPMSESAVAVETNERAPAEEYNGVKSDNFPARLSYERQLMQDDDDDERDEENLIKSRRRTLGGARRSGSGGGGNIVKMGAARSAHDGSGRCKCCACAQCNGGTKVSRRCECCKRSQSCDCSRIMPVLLVPAEPPPRAPELTRVRSMHQVIHANTPLNHPKIIKTDVKQSSFESWPPLNEVVVMPPLPLPGVVGEEFTNDVAGRTDDGRRSYPNERVEQTPAMDDDAALNDEEYLSVEDSQPLDGYNANTFNHMTFNPSEMLDEYMLDGLDSTRTDDSAPSNEFVSDFSPIHQRNENADDDDQWRTGAVDDDDASTLSEWHRDVDDAPPRWRPPRSVSLKRQQRRPSGLHPYGSRHKRSYVDGLYTPPYDGFGAFGNYETETKVKLSKPDPTLTDKSIFDRASSPGAPTKSIDDIWYSAYNMSAPLPFLTTELRFFRKHRNTWWTVAPTNMLSNTSSVYASRNRSTMSLYHTAMLKTGPASKSSRTWLLVDEKTNETREFRVVCGDETTPGSGQLKRKCQHLMPEYDITFELPLDENALIYPHTGSARISRIAVDLTSPSGARVQVLITNTGLSAVEFHLGLADCPVEGETNLNKMQLVEPRQSHTFDFTVQMLSMVAHESHTCTVSITDGVGRTVARRPMLVRPRRRCFCVWTCACACVAQFVHVNAVDMCDVLPVDDLRQAGFESEMPADHRNEVFNWVGVAAMLLAFFALVMLLGCLKALLGVCIQCIGKWKYDYMQPHQVFSESSHCKRFFINSIFFLVFPCVALCKCFNPEPGHDSPAHWKRSLVHKRSDAEMPDHDETDVLLKDEPQSPPVERLRAAGSFKDSSSSDRLFDSYNDDDEQRDTSYVLSALTESRLSLKLLDGHTSNAGTSPASSHRAASSRQADAMTYVNRLLTAKLVYRTVSGPMGHADVEPLQSFSVRGYFMPAMGPGYQFISHIPLRQHWRINKRSNTLEAIDPPLMLLPKDFTRDYANKDDVHRVHDLSVSPSVDAPCITVLIQDVALYLQSEEAKR